MEPQILASDLIQACPFARQQLAYERLDSTGHPGLTDDEVLDRAATIWAAAWQRAVAILAGPEPAELPQPSDVGEPAQSVAGV